ncbi:mechanosensitive ion channel family protein [Rubritalea tangerina]|uniref:Mechanosensitive ion channel family protein n=1 Tax=Rubritalea tangerina TaxID=430798 RepID=A0ABW4ZFH0_9BACT
MKSLILGAIFIVGGASVVAQEEKKEEAKVEQSASGKKEANPELEIELDATEPAEIAGDKDVVPKAEVVAEPNVKIPLVQLSAQMRSMRKEGLEKLLELWLKRLELQIENTAVYTYRIDAGELSESDRQHFIDLEKKSHEVELEIAKRARVVMRALEVKGGDVTEARAYLKAATDITSDLDSSSRVQYVFTLIGNWLKDADGGIAFGKALLGAFFILLSFWFVGKLVKHLTKRAFSKHDKGSRIMRDFVLRSITTVVMVIGLMVALSSIGIEVGPMIAALGAGGFIIGFALQETLGNFASGMMIMIYQPFDEGDYVEISGVAGRVEKMSLVSTTMLTMDNKELIIPNKKAWGDTITNYSGRRVRRVDLVFGIGYSDDIDHALEILREVGKAHGMVLAEPQLTAGVHSLGDSSVNLFLRPWARSVDYWDVYWDLTKQVKQKFDQEGISIPFPQRDVHIIQSAVENA